MRRPLLWLPLSAVLLVAFTGGGCASGGKIPPILSTVPVGSVSRLGDLPVLHLKGSPYDMGYQHGSLMRRQVQASVANAMAFANRQIGIPGVGRWMVRRRLDRAWRRMKPHIPARYLEEMEGLSDGAEIPLKVLQRVHAIPDLTSVTCASSACAGSATADGRMIHIRNLDWATHSNVQRYAALLVTHPAGQHAFVNVGWLGFIGVISGVSDRGISVGEIGAETKEAGLNGVPMPFLQRRVLEEADDLREAVDIICESPRTVGYNYVFADAQKKQAVALETTQRRCSAFWMDAEPKEPFAVSVPNAVLRSDFSLDPQVREKQLAAKGNPSKPGLESPLGSSAYEVRYRGQGLLLKRFHGSLDPEIAMAIARAIAPSSNMQSVVVAYPQMWVATAQGRRPAAQGIYQEVDLQELFR